MPKENPFVVLGVDENCTQIEAHDAYVRLRDQYRMDRLRDGEVGRNAAEKLTELEEAYARVLDIQRGRINYGGSGLNDVEMLLKENKVDDAQRALDLLSERNAEWHYLQAVVYLKRNWINDCRSQLETAIAMDPGNSKYTKALERLNAKGSKVNQGEDSYHRQAHHQNDPNVQRSYSQGTRRGVNACDVCNCLICSDCCCECMGGDCIPCC